LAKANDRPDVLFSSPLPTLRKTLAAWQPQAAAWAMIAGCIRSSGRNPGAQRARHLGDPADDAHTAGLWSGGRSRDENGPIAKLKPVSSASPQKNQIAGTLAGACVPDLNDPVSAVIPRRSIKIVVIVILIIKFPSKHHPPSSKSLFVVDIVTVSSSSRPSSNAPAHSRSCRELILQILFEIVFKLSS
jgi:hypothetical protein